MAYVFVVGSCVACGTFITFNPNYVPSIRVNGTRQPLCPSCHARWNEIHRTSKGLPPLPIHPEAYEPVSVFDVPFEPPEEAS